MVMNSHSSGPCCQRRARFGPRCLGPLGAIKLRKMHRRGRKVDLRAEFPKSRSASRSRCGADVAERDVSCSDAGRGRLGVRPRRACSRAAGGLTMSPRIRRVPAFKHRCRVDDVTRQTADDEKQARLAAALRENLKRRKAQARARRADEAQGRDHEAAPPAQADTNRT